MTTIDALALIDRLPLSRRQEVFDFIEFLAQREGRQSNVGKPAPLLRDDTIGIWAERSDLADPSRWVRDLRHKEWT